MEFEKSKPTTTADIALADAPKVTLQPVHLDVRAEPATTDYTHQNEGVFDFETETTDQAAARQSLHHPHRKAAFAVALAITALFCGGLSILYALR